MAAANLLAGVRGERLPTPVNPEIYGLGRRPPSPRQQPCRAVRNGKRRDKGCSVPDVLSLRSLARVSAAVVLVVAAFAAAPSTTSAACGGGAFGDPDDYARRAGRIADTIILGRLVEIDADANNALHFELLEVYRGEALGLPIDNTFESDNGVGIIHVGSCARGEGVKPGGLFIYATGPRAARFGPMQLVFPRIPERGWIINHCCEYGSLNELLVLLGVLPPTTTDETSAPTRQGLGLGTSVAIVAGLTWLFYLVLGSQPRLRSPRSESTSATTLERRPDRSLD